MSRILGFDIGGANTKAVMLSINQDQAQPVFKSQYYPFWKDNPERLANMLKKLGNPTDQTIQAIAVTITAELSDIFETKADGVTHIIKALEEAFPRTPLTLLNSQGSLVSSETAQQNPLSVAAANWYATGWLVARHVATAIIIDTGSTSTSIIPIKNGKVVAQGKTDLEKLQYGELVYSGALRTTVPAIVANVPINDKPTRIASEWFAQSGDVHIILGHLQPEEYTVDTPDNRSTSRSDALSRLARVVCADRSMLSDTALQHLAEYIYHQQLTHIAAGITQVRKHLEEHSAPTELHNLQYIGAGLGRKFLSVPAALRAGLEKGQLMEQLFNEQVAYSTPAYGIAIMLAESLGR